MVTRIAILAFCMLFSSVALADETIVHHAPISAAAESEDLVVTTGVERPDLSKRVILVYTAATGMKEIPFERDRESSEGFVAQIPAADVHPPGLAYAIEIEDTAGVRHEAFARRTAMHEIEVLEDETDARERVQLDANDKRRSALTASTEYAYFGTVQGTLGTQTIPIRDEYWRVDGSYTYRVLRTVAEFGISFGVVRGSSYVANATTAKDFDVGLNYGAPRIRFRATNWLHFDLMLLTSITEVGFSVGGGGAVILGSPYATHLTFGGEGVQVFGGRGWVRLDVPAGKHLTLAPSVEVTNMPHASNAGMRLMLDANVRLAHGFSFGLRAGYMARVFTEGGFGGGAQVGYAF